MSESQDDYLITLTTITHSQLITALDFQKGKIIFILFRFIVIFILFEFFFYDKWLDFGHSELSRGRYVTQYGWSMLLCLLATNQDWRE